MDFYDLKGTKNYIDEIYPAKEKLKKLAIKNNDHISFKDFDNLIEDDAKNLSIDFDVLLKKYVNGLEGMKLSLEENKDLVIAQSYLANTADEFNYAWLKFNNSDKEEYKKKYEDIIQVFAASLLLPTGKILVEAGDSGTLEFLENIEDIKYSEKEERFYLLSEEDNMSSVKKKVDWVLNATGLDLSMKSLDLNKTF